MTSSTQDQRTESRVAQIILGILVIVFFIMFVNTHILEKTSDGGYKRIFMLFELTILLLLSRLSILTKVGVGFANLIMTGVMLVFGLMPVLVMIWVTTAAYIYLAVRPTPIDFAINKGVASALNQCVYLSLWALTMAFVYKAFGIPYIVGNLVFVFMISVSVYVFYMMICLKLFTVEPIPMILLNGVLTLGVQYMIITYVGMQFIKYMLGFG